MKPVRQSTIIIYVSLQNLIKTAENETGDKLSFRYLKNIYMKAMCGLILPEMMYSLAYRTGPRNCERIYTNSTYLCIEKEKCSMYKGYLLPSFQGYV